jgi:ATP-dependent Clp protease ATP-binding subunit ClpC
MKVLDLAVDECRQLGHGTVRAEHLLLGLVREGEGIGAMVIESLGAKLAPVREAALRHLSGAAGSAG